MCRSMLFLLVFVCVVVCKSSSEDSTNNLENDVSGRSINPRDVLSSIASNLMSRGGYGRFGYAPSGTGSQIISLNLTNLLVLFLLKALIFAAGTIGAGHYKGGYGRSLDGDEKILTDEEMLMFLSYLTGAPGENGCLQNVACHQPYQAKKYVNAGDLLLKTAKLFQLNPDINYDYVLKEVETASNAGLAGASCNTKFKCSYENKNEDGQ